MSKRLFVCAITLLVVVGCKDDDTPVRELTLLEAFVGNTSLSLTGTTGDLPVDRNITLIFSSPLDEASVQTGIQIIADGEPVEVLTSFQPDGKAVTLRPVNVLKNNTEYIITLSPDLRGKNGARINNPVSIHFKTTGAPLLLSGASIGNTDIRFDSRAIDVPLNLALSLDFSAPVDETTLENAVSLSGAAPVSLSFALSGDKRRVEVSTATSLKGLSRYELRIASTLKGAEGETFDGFSKLLYTRADEALQFPVIPEDELLTLVQAQTFGYFWDFAHPASGMARERNSSGDLVTSGGSGFGIMALIVGMERGFITRAEGLERMAKILSFLETADRFHGAWPHWMNGNTGKVIPFSANDNGGDLVETSFLMQGLITFRQYLKAGVAEEKDLIDRINALWHSVEWDWYTRDGGDVLYWHWSPDKAWAMNLPVRGYNEALITYFLAAASPTHAIDAEVYHKGWARDGAIRNGRVYYGNALPLGPDYGGPLFFSHYSFLGLDPRNLTDTYGDYWMQNVNHARIHHAYCADNPKKFAGYSAESWGLTASDNHQGYSAHSPANDLGVITPTAALSSFPYTPEESMAALKFFYYKLGDRLWGPYGFYDAFNVTEQWVAGSYLAIDQGPIIIMIENYRTQLLWELFMSAPEVETAIDKLGFSR